MLRKLHFTSQVGKYVFNTVTTLHAFLIVDRIFKSYGFFTDFSFFFVKMKRGGSLFSFSNNPRGHHVSS